MVYGNVWILTAVCQVLKFGNAHYLLIMDSDGQCLQIFKFWNAWDLNFGYRIKRKIFYIENFSRFCKTLFMDFFLKLN